MSIRVTYHFRVRVEQRMGLKLTDQEVAQIVAGVEAELEKEPPLPEEDVVRLDVYMREWDCHFVAVYSPHRNSLMTAYAPSDPKRYIAKQQKKGLRKLSRRLRHEGFDSAAHKRRYVAEVGKPRKPRWN